ncbi:MAG: hypothetical protein HYW10_00480 [Candidatus Omnitrophica bacterium]|nr:hypothetical protein [Candidatus Omnitrophota bacterium]
MLLLYSSGMTMRAATQRLASDKLEDRVKALHLAQGAMEQLREDLFVYLSNYVNAQIHLNDAMKAFEWLDALGTHTENPPLNVPTIDRTGDGKVTWADMDPSATHKGAPGTPRCVEKLPTIKATAVGDAGCKAVGTQVDQPRAWIVSVVNPSGGALGTRILTLEAEARVGSVTKHLQAQYEIAMSMSDIFKYGYFINNYGWFTAANGSEVTINGEVRANGNLSFRGTRDNDYQEDIITNIVVNGDLYASQSPARPADGTVGGGDGDPAMLWGWAEYWSRRNPSQVGGATILYGPQARPARRLVKSDMPAIGGIPKLLPLGSGWDETTTGLLHANNGQQAFTVAQRRQLERQPTHDIPYLGDLGFYRPLAQNSSLTYNDPGPDGRYGNADDNPDGRPRITTEYTGAEPLVLVGTPTNPIVINGPVIVPRRDVIIKGVVSGRGTIYAGRNLHIAGAITYQAPPEWPIIEREYVTGLLKDAVTKTYLGRICDDGRYYTLSELPPGGPAPANCTGSPVIVAQ